jgi:hypothetical protein
MMLGEEQRLEPVVVYVAQTSVFVVLSSANDQMSSIET